MSDTKKHVLIDYTNHAGVRSVREILPSTGMIYFGSTEWHPESQWLLDAYDVKKDDLRTFAMKDIHRWGVQPDRQMEIDLSIAAQLQRSMELNARMKNRLRSETMERLLHAITDRRVAESIRANLVRIQNDNEPV